MKRILVLFSLFFTFVLIAQETINENDDIESINEIKAEKQAAENSNKLYQIIENLRKYEIESKDTDLQRKSKEANLKADLIKLNRELKGEKILLRGIKLENIEEETKLSKRGEKKLQEKFNELKKNPNYAGYDFNDPFSRAILTMGFLFNCNDCFEKTGNLILVYEFQTQTPFKEKYNENEFETIYTTIKKIVPNNQSFNSISRDTIMDVSGKIILIKYEPKYSTERLELLLSE